MKEQKVIHVELKEPFNGKRNYYFGSKAAIYEDLSEDLIGIKKESLWNVDLDKVEYQNKFCTIRMGTLKRKQTDRGYKFKMDLKKYYESVNTIPGEEGFTEVVLPSINLKQPISEERLKELNELIEDANKRYPDVIELIKDILKKDTHNITIHGNNK